MVMLDRVLDIAPRVHPLLRSHVLALMRSGHSSVDLQQGVILELPQHRSRNGILILCMQVMSAWPQALSPVGRCKTFDATSDGYGRGEGFAIALFRCAIRVCIVLVVGPHHAYRACSASIC